VARALKVSCLRKALVMVGAIASKTARVLGIILAANLFGLGAALAEGGDQLFAPRPDHPIIESSQRVSDGRKLQQDADGCFRRAEGGAGQEVGSEAADHKGEESARGEVAAAAAAARAASSADR
jgi:hypothetical protein